MDEKALLEYISTDEDHYMEFKSGFIRTSDLSDYMMLFANADGGTILLGVDEKAKEPSGKIREITKNETDSVHRAAIDGLKPPLDGVKYETVNCPSYGNCKVLAISVPDSPKLHQNLRGTIARRRGSEREPIFIGRELTEVVSKTDYDYDVHPLAGYTMEDVDPRAIKRYRERYLKINPTSKINDLTDKELLERKKGLVDNEGILTPTLTGILFFGVDVEEIVPFSRVDFVQYAGSEIGESEGDEVYLDRKTIKGTIPEIISECERLVTDRIASKGYLRNGFDRKEIAEYPLFAYREAIINALCHRDYSLRGASVQIRLFSDRLEVQSPGSLRTTRDRYRYDDKDNG
jgi:ATP-dependent DNA helicase RecG